jgi:hypothetical protein
MRSSSAENFVFSSRIGTILASRTFSRSNFRVIVIEEKGAPGEHLIKDNTHAEDIGPLVHAAAPRLLRRHVQQLAF